MKFLSGELQLEWTNARVCDGCFETRHPQEFIKTVPEADVPWTREANEINISPLEYFDYNYFEGFDATHMPSEYINLLGQT